MHEYYHPHSSNRAMRDRLLYLHTPLCYKLFTKNVPEIGNQKLLQNINSERQKKSSKFT
jgi:hypothetical protein